MGKDLNSSAGNRRGLGAGAPPVADTATTTREKTRSIGSEPRERPRRLCFWPGCDFSSRSHCSHPIKDLNPLRRELAGAFQISPSAPNKNRNSDTKGIAVFAFLWYNIIVRTSHGEETVFSLSKDFLWITNKEENIRFYSNSAPKSNLSLHLKSKHQNMRLEF